jgi:hypothetical protein
LGRKNPDKSRNPVAVEQLNTEKAELALVMKKEIENFVDTAHRNPCGLVSLPQTPRDARKTHYCRLILRTSNEKRKFA